jgi:outer membrane immunogenic protein
MKKQLALIAACLAAGAAAAADLPSVKGPPAPPPPPAFSWTGPYVGLNIGHGWADSTTINGFALTPAFAFTGAFWAPTSPNASGVIGGVQAGYNYQFNGTGFVVGFETDFNGADVQGTNFVGGSPVTGTGVIPFIRTHQSLDWFGTVRGRVGYAILPSLLVFGTGGFAYGHTSNNFVIGFTNGYFDGASHGSTRTGWAAGGGFEWAFTPNLSLKFEYIYVDLGNGWTLWDGAGGNPCCVCNNGCPPNPQPQPPGPATFISAQTGTPNRFHTARVGLNYRFNLFGPAVTAPSVLASY